MTTKSEKERITLHMLADSVDTLVHYSRMSKDSYFMEEILDEILKRRFEELNVPGEKPKYGRKANEGSIGSVWLGRANNRDEHCMDINFCPCPESQMRYIQKVIGVVDLSRKTYGTNISSYEPIEIFSHLGKIMNEWGLKRTAFRRTLED